MSCSSRPPLAFRFTGEQQRLALVPAPNSLLYRAAVGDGDETRLEVTAVNTSGRPTIPAGDLTIRITGPGGETVAERDIRRSVVREGSRRYVQLQTTATRALETGRYTLRVSRGAAAATQTSSWPARLRASCCAARPDPMWRRVRS